MKTEKNEKGGDAAKQTVRPCKEISKSEPINVSHCQHCGSTALEFGSRDPCEGDAYWCGTCGYGPVWFPLGEGPLHSLARIIDADKANEALRIVALLKKRKRPVIIQEPVKASPHPFLDDIVTDETLGEAVARMRKEHEVLQARIADIPNMPEVE